MDTKAPYDILGNIALVKFSRGTKVKEKKKIADKILKKNRSITTVLEKTGGFKGRLRKQETKFVSGVKTKEAIYRENNCVFRFNVDSVYFSSRLSNERKEVAGKIKKKDNVFVMFAGAAPFSVVIAKNSKAEIIYSNEINKEANKYGRLNAELNNVKNKIIFFDGDIKKIAGKIKNKFDVIVMPRPQLKDSFLKEVFLLSKKGTRVYYYDFCKEKEIHEIVEKVKKEATKNRKKIKILKVKKAGEIAAYRYRIRIDFVVV
ncbi:MAG: hypothetical protein ABSG05_02845 [Candidatus Pacearchaeota archaeon]|jgi:tRNA (guanine37-N1)-methyltransferase